MKVRYETRCARCRNPLRKGQRALRMYGNLWHLACVNDYRAHREALRAHPAS